MRRTIATAVLAAFLTVPAVAGAQSGVSGWDGKNPFDCVLQQAGEGVDFPNPEADPFCVEYQKRHQNVNNLGVVDFLSKEPARVAQAGPKCFYFQHDHWVGSVVEGNQQTQTYAWDGSYYYDKATGTGGTYVENFTVNGQTGDPTLLPGFPSEYKPYFGNGRGGVRRSDQVDVEPSCVAKAEKKSPYPPPPGTEGYKRCRVPGGSVRRGIGGIKLGATRAAVRRTLGQPTKASVRWVWYCMSGGGRLVARFDDRGPGGRAVLIVTNARPFDLRGIRAGQTTAKVRGKLRPFKRLISKRGGKRLLRRREKKQVLLVGTHTGTVEFIAVGRPKLADKRLIRLLKRTPSWKKPQNRR